MKHRVPRRVERGERFGFGAAQARLARQARLLVRAERRRHRLHAPGGGTRELRRHAVVRELRGTYRVRYRVPRVERARDVRHERRQERGQGFQTHLASPLERVRERDQLRAQAPRRARRGGGARARGGGCFLVAQRHAPGLGGDAQARRHERHRVAPDEQTARLREAQQRFGVLHQRRQVLRARRRVGRRTRGRRRLRRRSLVVARPRLVLARPRLRSRRASLDALLGELRDGGGGARHEGVDARRRHDEREEPLQFVVHAAEGEDVQLARLRDVAHGDGERVLPRRAVHARAHQQLGPVAFAPAPLARAHHERPRVGGGILREPELLRGEVHRAVDVGEVRGLLVAEHRERHAGRRPGSHGEAGARGREVLPARAPVVQEDALRAILVELHGGGERALGQDVAARRANLAPEVELVPHVRLAARGAARGARRLAAHRGGRTEEGRARAILMQVSVSWWRQNNWQCRRSVPAVVESDSA